MSATDRLDVLRKRNKDLLNQLKQQREKVERLYGCGQSRKREREDEAEQKRDPADILILTDGDRGPARAALAKPTVRFADTCEGQTGTQSSVTTPSETPKDRGGSAEHSTPSHLVTDSDSHPQVQDRLQGTRPAGTKSCLVNSKEKEMPSRVTFQSDERDEIPASDRHRLQPLLGYDWIAGVLDAEGSLIEHSDEFYNDLRVFRLLNKDECVHSPQAEFSEEMHSGLPLLTDHDSPEANMDIHQCTFSYRINSRLFPVPLHSQECCPVCKKHKSSHPHTAAEPALVRVSIPHSALLPPYKHKAHRRCSFDPSDSLGLPSHCLSGWSNKGQSRPPPPSNLDLRSSLNTRSSTGSRDKELEVCSLPYQADSDGNCRNSSTEYLSDVSNLCCKKCNPGQRLRQTCTETTETVCEQCPAGQYMEGRNYSPNCFSCNRCKSVKGLREVQNCSPTTRSKCGCQPGMYCIMGFDDPYCSACSKYKPCKAGYGVLVPGTANSDVKCQRCPDGTFSDSVSHMDHCRPHTDCHGRVVVRKGDATSDTECDSEAFASITRSQKSTKWPHVEIAFTTASTMMSTVSEASDSKAPRGPTDSTLTFSSVSEAAFNHSTKSPPPSTVSDGRLAAILVSCIGVVLLFIAIIVLFRRKTVKKDAAIFHPKVDANGNCESGDKINQSYLGEIQQTSFTVTSAEQQCLLEKGDGSSDQSQCGSSNTETFIRADDYNSCESIGPLLSTLAQGPPSALSEPMTLLSNTEPVAPQSSVTTQCSSQPTSPQVISPVTTSPQVNVNITFHIGNGSGGTPSIIPTDVMHVNSKLPIGEEEESFSIPQQEDGKQSLMSVQESSSYGT
ncbi:uncharacterized protein miip isoform X2 [Chaetodon trifascialis]|uniref:uncharacterized protein miip isoform X2 n=1 Tax=Chaetodon trifascialis TaxID=109706 RepID=UPI003995BD53